MNRTAPVIASATGRTRLQQRVHVQPVVWLAAHPHRVKRLEVLDDAARESVRGNGGVWQKTVLTQSRGDQ